MPWICGQNADWRWLVATHSFSNLRALLQVPSFTPACAACLPPRARTSHHVLLRGSSIAQGRVGSDMGTRDSVTHRALARLAKTCSSPLSRFPSFSLLLSTERV